MKPPDVKQLRTSTTTALYSWEMDLELYRQRAPEAAERAMDSALERGGLTNPSRAREAIARHETLYLQRRNPFDVFEAFVIARGARLETPEWILDYLERSTKRLLLRVRGTRKDRPRAIAEAFDLAPLLEGRSRKGNRPDAMEQLDHDHLAAKVVQTVAELRKGMSIRKPSKRMSRVEAIDIACKRLNVSDTVAKRALKLHGR